MAAIEELFPGTLIATTRRDVGGDEDEDAPDGDDEGTPPEGPLETLPEPEGPGLFDDD